MHNNTFRCIPFKEGDLSSWDSSEVGNWESCLDVAMETGADWWAGSDGGVPAHLNLDNTV